jgi:murein L,D-transpeptidase YafK
MQTRSDILRVIAFLMMLAPVMVAVPLRTAPAAVPPVELVLVYKSRQTMLLLKGNEVVRSYKVALGRNPRGRKQEAGDCRTPEGSYIIDRHTKGSRFYRALHISYPSREDLAAARNHGRSAGGEIMIHGLPKGFEDLAGLHFKRNWTKGCIAVDNAEMDELWQLVADGTPIVIMP